MTASAGATGPAVTATLTDRQKPQTTRKRRTGKPVGPRNIVVRYPNGRMSSFPYRAGEEPAFIEFLQQCAASHSPRWYKQISFRRVEPATGEEASGFETVSFAYDANGNPPDWDKVRRWIDERHGHGNFYWTNPAGTVTEANRAPALGQEATTKADKASILLPVDPDVKVPESIRRVASPKTDLQCGSPVYRATNGAAAPIDRDDDDTGLANPACIAALEARASKVPPQVVGPVVPKDDHMGRSRIYRKEKRPNLYHYRDDFYDYEGGHYAMIDDHTIEANLYSF